MRNVVISVYKNYFLNMRLKINIICEQELTEKDTSKIIQNLCIDEIL